MDTQKQLFGLMIVAEEQQKAAGAVLANLTDELSALSEQRAAFGVEVEALSRLPEEAISTIQRATEQAVTLAVRQALGGLSNEALVAFHASSKPFFDSLERASADVHKAEGKLRTAVRWFSWRWLAMLTASTGGVLLAVGLLGFAAVERQHHELAGLRGERERMAAEVAELHEQADLWAKRGGRAKLERCGDEKRLCVRVIPGQEYGKDHFVLYGY